ncbi:thiol:disulfide interchange protein DsbC [Thiobacillus denitrificans ATCC 25259]|uniref:Thiol:disulfide interchange protein n=1 Tax=Thiobacillus denitrificans (strain ATCC 25259 / T1) TaxID=292415 RepID=Q3SGG6_THIDA|nr:DsbC family protein [Thiobacillus denitrificans]AAZ98284.1 thiol:disulfide interchange protein DsbC [Thiobacillus denitrificans ATCC 25259]
MKFTSLALAASLMFAAAAHADEKLIRKTLAQQFPGAKVSSVKPTPYSGLFEVYLDGQLVYVDAKAKYVFAGDVIDLKNRTNLTQARLNQLQAVSWDVFPLNNALKTVKGNGARKLVLFSDVDCPYCRKFEAELTKVDNITVYTFLYPIAGLHPKAVQTSKQIWCAPDRNKAWDAYITRGTVPDNDGKCANPVDATIALGNRLKVNGTPTLFFANGVRVPGMVPAAQLERLLAANAK